MASPTLVRINDKGEREPEQTISEKVYHSEEMTAIRKRRNTMHRKNTMDGTSMGHLIG
jgi:hypothetical protein